MTSKGTRTGAASSDASNCTTPLIAPTCRPFAVAFRVTCSPAGTRMGSNAIDPGAWPASVGPSTMVGMSRLTRVCTLRSRTFGKPTIDVSERNQTPRVWRSLIAAGS